ncbi:prepilin peptidase [Sandarakinorhabdus sp. AAP62]|uniref:A24 family peptidase n=1 Tax=Sandarakinorhabdus sp. AAP62 TaxID=1248916 RepID=UPI00036A71FA|nr:prepilin peptidase [Sandarakinorhabdus sp. AAP62]
MTLADAGFWLMALSVLASAGFDLRTFEIPDTITVLIIIGVVLFGLGTPGFNWASHAAAGGVFFAFGLLAFARGWLGGGDVKVMTGCACWATLGTLLQQVVLIAIAGGVLALVLMLLRRGLALAGVTGDDAPRLVQVGADLPYAVGIAGGMAVWGWRFLPLP